MLKLALLIVAALACLALAAPAKARQPESEPRPPVIVVSGNASLDVAPDQVEMNISIVTEGPQAQGAISENNRNAARVMEALQRKGLGDREATTGAFSVMPVYTQRRPQDANDFVPRIAGYRVQNTIQVKTKQKALAGDLIQAAVEAGANSVDSVRFTLSDETEHRRRAISDAVRSAHADAVAAAAAAGVSLAGVRRMDVGHSGGGPRPMFARGMADMVMAESVPMNPGDVTISANVTIEYLIEPKR